MSGAASTVGRTRCRTSAAAWAPSVSPAGAAGSSPAVPGVSAMSTKAEAPSSGKGDGAPSTTRTFSTSRTSRTRVSLLSPGRSSSETTWAETTCGPGVRKRCSKRTASSAPGGIGAIGWRPTASPSTDRLTPDGSTRTVPELVILTSMLTGRSVPTTGRENARSARVALWKVPGSLRVRQKKRKGVGNFLASSARKRHRASFSTFHPSAWPSVTRTIIFAGLEPSFRAVTAASRASGTFIVPPVGASPAKAASTALWSAVGFWMMGRGTEPATKRATPSPGSQTARVAWASSMARWKFVWPSSVRVIEREPSTMMATSFSPPLRDQWRVWRKCSTAEVMSAKATRAPAAPRRSRPARRWLRIAMPTPAHIAADRIAGRTMTQGMVVRLGMNGRAIARATNAIARHRKANRMISSMRMRRLRLVRESRRNRMAPQSTMVARWRFSRWMRMGMATAASPASMMGVQKIISFDAFAEPGTCLRLRQRTVWWRAARSQCPSDRSRLQSGG